MSGRIISMALAGAILLAGSAQAAPACRVSPGDRAAVESAVRGFFAALGAEDAAALRRVTAPEFYAFDVGKRFGNAAELAEVVRQGHAQGRVIEWNIGPVDAHVGCDQAWAAWENNGRAGPPSNVTAVRWLESAVLRREGGHWVLVFLHSTRAPTAN